MKYVMNGVIMKIAIYASTDVVFRRGNDRYPERIHEVLTVPSDRSELGSTGSPINAGGYGCTQMFSISLLHAEGRIQCDL